jgi:hypothetical protein
MGCDNPGYDLGPSPYTLYDAKREIEALQKLVNKLAVCIKLLASTEATACMYPLIFSSLPED